MQNKHVFSICAYKDSPYLEQCIRSLTGQSVKSRIILCTSTPSSYIEELAEKYKLPLFVREGVSNIRDDWNFAYAMAEADFVTIAHQDDVYHKDYTACLLKAAARYRDMTVFTTDYVILKNGRILAGEPMLWVKRLLRLPLRIPALNHIRLIKRLPLMFGNSICCPATSYNKKVLGESFVDSDYSFALDWDNMLRLADTKGRFVCVERPLLYYRVHDEAATKACIGDRRRETEEREMFARFWPGPVVELLMRFYRQAYKEYS